MSTALTLSKPTLTIRQTNLRWILETCPAGAYALAVADREGPHYGGAARGTAIHEVFSRYTAHLFESRRQTDWEAATKIAHLVLSEYPGLSYAEYQDVLEQAENIGRGFLFEPAHYYGSEESLFFDLDLLDGRVVRITGRLDLLEADIDEGWARIKDVKSNHFVPTDRAVAEDTQLKIYSLLVVHNLPVDLVYGSLWLTRYGIHAPHKDPAVWTRDELLELEAFLRVKLQAFLNRGSRQEFVPGNHCAYCPRRRVADCSHWQRGGLAGAILTPAQATRAGARLVALEQQTDGLKAALKDYVREHGPVRIGSTSKAETWAFWPSESDEYRASELLELLDGPAVEAFTSQYGPLDIDQVLSVNKRGKAFKALLKSKELGADIKATGVHVLSTPQFRHKGGEAA